jgi:hypothetical protein
MTKKMVLSLPTAQIAEYRQDFAGYKGAEDVDASLRFNPGILSAISRSYAVLSIYFTIWASGRRRSSRAHA